jgi:hypothetical protein
MKRILWAVPVLALCVCPVAAQQETDFRTDGNGTITGYSCSAKNVVIPASIGGKPVTAVGAFAFALNELTDVTIPDGITSIGKSAFAFNLLTSVTIPDSVTSIGTDAFYYNELTSVTIPANVLLGEHFAFGNNGFNAAYNNNGKKAGTYTYDGRYWSYRAR